MLDQVDLVNFINQERAKPSEIFDEDQAHKAQVSVLPQLHVQEECIKAQDPELNHFSALVEQKEKLLQTLKQVPCCGQIELHQSEDPAVIP